MRAGHNFGHKDEYHVRLPWPQAMTEYHGYLRNTMDESHESTEYPGSMQAVRNRILPTPATHSPIFPLYRTKSILWFLLPVISCSANLKTSNIYMYPKRKWKRIQHVLSHVPWPQQAGESPVQPSSLLQLNLLSRELVKPGAMDVFVGGASAFRRSRCTCYTGA